MLWPSVYKRVCKAYVLGELTLLEKISVNVQKQKKQNEILKEQFKKLNEQLTNTLNKIQSKVKVEQEVKGNDNRL